MIDLIEKLLQVSTQLMVAVAAVFGVRFAWRARRHNQQTEHQANKGQWRPDVITGINNFLRVRNADSEPGEFDLRPLQRPHQDPRLKVPYCAVSGVEVNEPERRVESLASHDVEQAELVDALVEGLGLLGLGELTRDRDWLLANTLLGGAGDDIERRSTDLVPAASAPPDERNKYRFALVRHEPFVVWVYLIGDTASRRKRTHRRRPSSSAARQPHQSARTTRPGTTPGLRDAKRQARERDAGERRRCERGGITLSRCWRVQHPRQRRRGVRHDRRDRATK